jgi:hypothetical protein
MSLKGRSCWDVNIRMDDGEKLSLEAMGRFVEASKEIRFVAESRQADGPFIYSESGARLSGAVPRSSRPYRDERVFEQSRSPITIGPCHTA